jgi:hypothetical protein
LFSNPDANGIWAELKAICSGKSAVFDEALFKKIALDNVLGDTPRGRKNVFQ